MNDYMDSMVLQNNEELIETLNDEYDILLNNTVKYLSKAKEAHLMVESMYIPNMNFTQIGALIEELETELDK